MGLFERFRRRSSDDAASGESGYYALYESQRPYEADDEFGERTSARAAPDYDAWDAKLSRLDSHVEQEERRRLPWWRPAHYRGRRKRW